MNWDLYIILCLTRVNFVNELDKQNKYKRIKESILKTTNEETRKRYIKSYLNEETSDYILNRDYGKTTEREHYHAIVKPRYATINYKRYKYGFIKGERLNQLKRFTNKNKSLEDVAESLTEHATKNSTRDNKIIYSRTQKKSH